MPSTTSVARSAPTWSCWRAAPPSRVARRRVCADLSQVLAGVVSELSGRIWRAMAGITALKGRWSHKRMRRRHLEGLPIEGGTGYRSDRIGGRLRRGTPGSGRSVITLNMAEASSIILRFATRTLNGRRCSTLLWIGTIRPFPRPCDGVAFCRAGSGCGRNSSRPPRSIRTAGCLTSYRAGGSARRGTNGYPELAVELHHLLERGSSHAIPRAD